MALRITLANGEAVSSFAATDTTYYLKPRILSEWSTGSM